jgi:putative oxidoreductase
MLNLALLTLRVTTGALLAGHGAQKLFGAFGGPGIEGTGKMLEEHMGLRPGRMWAPLAGAAEFGGGVLTLLGFLHPLGPLAIASAMAMATLKAHWGKPIWVTSGGAELPVTNMAIMAALAMAGPGRYSLDAALGIRVPAAMTLLASAGSAALATAGATNALAPLAEKTEAA